VLVCDQCGHVAAHLNPPTVLVPHQPKGTIAHVVLTTTECERATCRCNFYVPRDLLPSEPAL
jgi:dethiobiotin synthetase